jgi:sugar phosphate isomerase/epimerase
MSKKGRRFGLWCVKPRDIIPGLGAPGVRRYVGLCAALPYHAFMADSPFSLALNVDPLGGDARAAFEIAAGQGYRGITFGTGHAQLNPTELSGTGQRQLRQILASKSLTIGSIRAAGPRGGLSSAESVDQTVAQARQASDLARARGVANVSVDAGALAEPERVMGAARELAAAADRAGVTINFSADAVPALETFLTALAFDRAKANADTRRIIAAGGDPTSSLQVLNTRLGQLTAADAIRTGATLRAVELGAGQTRWADVVALLRELEFRGPLVVDPRQLTDPVAGAAAAAHLLERLLRAPQ